MTGRRKILVAITAAALACCYASTLYGMARQWWNDEDMGHGFLVPAVAAWILWRERRRWQSLPMEASAWGAPLILLGALAHAAGALGAGLFLSSLGFLMSVTGAVLWLGGWALLRAWAFPLLLCLFMLPKLAILYNQATLPLQLLASHLAAGMLSIAGIGVIRAGNILDVGGRQVLVTEACNGIRYLLPLGFVGVLFAYLSHPAAWMRVVVLALAVPLAILANAVRVAVSAGIPALDSGTPHMAAGWIIFVLTLAALASATRLFGRVPARLGWPGRVPAGPHV
jgi:exosortase